MNLHILKSFSTSFFMGIVYFEKVPEFLVSPMAILKLSTSNHATFTSLIWGGLASAPYDLHLVTEVNMKAL